MYSNTTPHTFGLEHYSKADYPKKSKRFEFILPLLLILIGCIGLFMLLSN